MKNSAIAQAVVNLIIAQLSAKGIDTTVKHHPKDYHTIKLILKDLGIASIIIDNDILSICLIAPLKSYKPTRMLRNLANPTAIPEIVEEIIKAIN